METQNLNTIFFTRIEIKLVILVSPMIKIILIHQVLHLHLPWSEREVKHIWKPRL